MKSTKLLNTVSLLIVELGLAVNGYSQSFLTNGLVAYYPFNGNANDASGNGHNGVVNGTSISPTNNHLGVPNQALHFGGDSYIAVTPTPFDVNTNWTITFWCKLDAGIGANNFVSTGEDSSGGLNIRYCGGCPLAWQCGSAYTGSPPSPGCSANATNNPNSWNLLTCVRSGHSFEMFLNDVLAASNTSTTVGATLNTGALWFGNHQSWATYYLLGSLSDLRIYNRALSPTEVGQLYAIESGPRVDFDQSGQAVVQQSHSHHELPTADFHKHEHLD